MPKRYNKSEVIIFSKYILISPLRNIHPVMNNAVREPTLADFKAEQPFIMCANISKESEYAEILSKITLCDKFISLGNITLLSSLQNRIKLGKLTKCQYLRRYPQRHIAISSPLMCQICFFLYFCLHGSQGY